MGIYHLYSKWLSGKSRHGIFLKSLQNTVVSSLSLDLNGIIHTTASIVYAYADPRNVSPRVREALVRRRSEIRSMNMNQLKLEHFSAIVNEIAKLIQEVRPLDTLVIAVDGVAPDAKLEQQRKRRYRSAMYRSPTDFDTNVFTPGTQYMLELDEYISQWIPTAQGSPSRIIYSGTRVPGEGEHKIMQFFREGQISPLTNETDSNIGSHIVYAKDADLIMLSMILPVDHIIIARESLDDLISIDRLRTVIQYDMQYDPNESLITLQQFESQNVIQYQLLFDFVVMAYLIGNDFLPHIISLDTVDIGFQVLFDTYRRIGDTLTYNPMCSNEQSDDDLWKINLNGLGEFFRVLNEKEPEILTRMAAKKYEIPFVTLEVATTREPNGNIVLDYTIFREEWYKKVFYARGSPNLIQFTESIIGTGFYLPTADKVTKMCNEYITGLHWILRYYQSGMENINVAYAYRYPYAPLLSDLYLVIETMNSQGYQVVDHLPVYGTPYFTPLHQLLAVMPNTSSGLLPNQIQVLTEPTSIILDNFPRIDSVYTDAEGLSEKTKFKEVVLVPPFNRATIIKAVNLVVSTSAQKKYTPGKIGMMSKTSGIYGLMDWYAYEDPKLIQRTRSIEELRNLIERRNLSTPSSSRSIYCSSDTQHQKFEHRQIKLSVRDPWLYYITKGQKTVEGRKGSYEKFRKWIGKNVILFNEINQQSVWIKDVRHYDDLYQYLDAEGFDKVLPGVESYEHAVQIYHTFYSDDNIRESGGMNALEISLSKPKSTHDRGSDRGSGRGGGRGGDRGWISRGDRRGSSRGSSRGGGRGLIEISGRGRSDRGSSRGDVRGQYGGARDRGGSLRIETKRNNKQKDSWSDLPVMF